MHLSHMCVCCAVQAALKCADLGHLTHTWAVHKKWVEKLEEEVFLQVNDQTYAHTHACTCTHTHTHAHMHAHTYTLTHTHTRAYSLTHNHRLTLRKHTHTRARTHSLIITGWRWESTHTHTHVCTYTRTHSHTHTHLHIHTLIITGWRWERAWASCFPPHGPVRVLILFIFYAPLTLSSISDYCMFKGWRCSLILNTQHGAIKVLLWCYGATWCY